MKINLQIDELVLEGFDYHDHKRISAAIKLELTRLIAEKGVGTAVDRGNDRGSINAPSFNVPFDRNPRKIGIEVARSIYNGLRR